jgi:hypothetical protein
MDLNRSRNTSQVAVTRLAKPRLAAGFFDWRKEWSDRKKIKWLNRTAMYMAGEEVSQRLPRSFRVWWRRASPLKKLAMPS